MKNKGIKKKTDVLNVVIFIILTVYALSFLFLLLWGFFNSLKPYSGPAGTGSFYENPFGLPKGWPWEWAWSNYTGIFLDLSIGVNTGVGTVRQVYIEELFLNSIIYALGCAVMLSITPCIMAYAVARYSYRFNAVINTIVIVALALPIVGALPSELQMAKALNLYDSFFGMLIMKANFLSMYYLVFVASFKGLSKTYADAAYIDGAGEATVCFRIMMPLVRNVILTIVLIQFIGFWNDFQTPLIYLPSKPTMAYGLYLFTTVGQTKIDEFGNTIRVGSKVTDQLAGAMVMLLPILILFVAFHNKLIGNISMGGIKE